MSIQNNLWQGRLISDDEFKKLFMSQKKNSQFWCKKPLSHHLLFELLEKMSLLLADPKSEILQNLKNDLQQRGDISESEIELSLEGLKDFIKIENLRTKVKRELGSEFPFELKRINFKENHFEAWFPLGVLVHVTPNNSPLLGVLGVMEGLLSGNVNLLKLARKDSSFAAIFYQKICSLDESKTIQDYIYIGKVSSSDKNYLKEILSIADVISAWGSEESIKSIRELSPSGARIVSWGHKISFSYFSKNSLQSNINSSNIQKLAYEICNNEQLACSSPQCVFVEDATFVELKDFGKQLKIALNKVSPTLPKQKPSTAELAELTVATEQVRLSKVFENSDLIVSKDNQWRIFIEDTIGLNASPLYRTIWIKPLPRNHIVQTLRPLKVYLQTVGLACEASEVEVLTKEFYLAGVQRIRAVGEMTDSYLGEPHDGVFALERYCQRITYSDSATIPLMKGKNTFDDFEDDLNIKYKKIMEKEDFQNQKVDEKFSELYFYSGGSSGEPKLSIFTYDDYHRQMAVAAEGLYAAGVDPLKDRCMNLFYAGSLYGGFISFFTILEDMEAVHFPMGASTDFALVAKTIITNKVDTLLGMPSYLLQLFTSQSELLKKYHGIKKIFYGGEHFSESQRQLFKNEFGVEVIRSASYGSVDAGPLGFQCEFSSGGIHHLHGRLHQLEVIDLEVDKPVKNGEVGRFLFTSKVRKGQKIERYAIGDVGRLIEGRCDCGRTGTRFELLGRAGDVFRIGTTFLSYQKFQKLLTDQFDFQGSFQIHLYGGGISKKERVLLKCENLFTNIHAIQKIHDVIIQNYKDLNEVVNKDLVLEFEVELTTRDALTFSSSTGKLRSVIDHREKA